MANDIGPSFGVVSNNNEDNDTTDVSTGFISFNDEGSGVPTVGFSTTSPLDLSGAPGFTLTWEVASATVLDNDGSGGITANGWFFGVQSLQGLEDVGTTLWNNNPAAIGITIFNSNSPGNDAVDLVSSVAGTGGTAESNIALLAEAPTLDSLNDGFSLTLTINSDDTWTASSTGLSTDFDTSGVLGSVSFSDVAPTLYVVSTLQSTLTSFAVANYESVKLQGPSDEGPGFNVDFAFEPGTGDLRLTWVSSEGKLYNLRSIIDPSADNPIDWPIFGDFSDLEATPPENTLSFPLPAEAGRFFVNEEFDTPPVSVFFDDFESGLGDWVVSNVTPGESPPTNWELGAPDPGLTGGPAAANSGTNCFGTNLASSTGFNVSIVLTSPVIDLTTASGATLSFAHFGNIDDGFDFGELRVLDADNGDAVLVVLDQGITGDFGWEMFSMSLPSEALLNNIKVEFTFSGDESNGGLEPAGWYIDDVQVTVP